MKIQVNDGNHQAVFELNNSSAAQSLIKQLPLTIKVENYSNDEKIFYPEKLATNNTPMSQGEVGDLAYFAPWGDVVMYYKKFQSYAGLYQLGKCVSGEDEIVKLKGTIDIRLV